MYHRFGETKYPSTNITVEQLESHLNYLVEQNYRFIQASDLLDPEQQKEKNHHSYDRRCLPFIL